VVLPVDDHGGLLSRQWRVVAVGGIVGAAWHHVKREQS
jgi:hypothetical protein